MPGAGGAAGGAGGAPARPPMSGVCFPLDGEKADSRSSTFAGKKVVAAALKAGGDAAGADACEGEKNWRFGYVKHFTNHVKNALSTREAAIKAAEGGLDAAYNLFRYIKDGKECSLAEALDGRFDKDGDLFHTGEIVGDLRAKSKPTDFTCKVPYKNGVLEGEKLLAQLEQWSSYGTIEPSAKEAIAEVSNHGSQWCDLRNEYFVVLGALSAMGPYQQLMDMGANVIALDLDRGGIWKILIEKARNSRGRLIFPLKKAQKDCKTDEELYENAGCDLISNAPAVAAWVAKTEPSQQLTVGCYVYLDGDMHVRVALACDMVMKYLVEKRKANIAFLCTPTDIHVIPEECVEAAESNYSLSNIRNIPLIPVRLLGGNKMLVKNTALPVKTQDNASMYYVKGLVVPQGPNYALAKRMQHWRSIVARERKQVIVSSNVAPSTATKSVISNKQFAWAYDGMPFFQPYEIFEQDTSNAVMTALLVHDLKDPRSAGNPKVKLGNPYELQKFTSFHGGVWRSGYTVGSIGEVSVIIHFIKVLKPVLLLLALALYYYKFMM